MKTSILWSIVTVFVLALSAFAQTDSIDVYIDPGHGGSDPGNIGAYIPNYDEKNVNLQIALLVKANLDEPDTITYAFSRMDDDTVELVIRVYDAMQKSSKSFISIHHNSTPNPSINHTLALFSSLPFSDDAPTDITPGTYWHWERNTDDKLAHKLALKIGLSFGIGLSSDTIPGLRDAWDTKTVLSRSTMASAITEASYISDSTEEEWFYYDTNNHREVEASAIFDAWESWVKGQGFAQVDYAYAGQAPTDSHDVFIQDYLVADTFKAPFLGVWNLDQPIEIGAINFNQSTYNYQFHHWEHKNHFDSTVISTYSFPVWIFNVDSAQDSTHWYVAYFKGGPFEIYTGTVGQMNIGTLDTVQWVCDPGVEGTGEFILQLSRNGGSTWTAIDTLPYNGANGNFLFPWSVTGPATQTAKLRFLAYDHADNKDTFVTFNFVICDGVADVDCDGITNSLDNCPTVSNSNQQDTDGDGVGNACDNCPTVANANQSNVDLDNWGDLCDNCPSVFQTNQSNLDGDSRGDLCDNCIQVANNDQADFDADGVGNVCDNCTNTYNPNQSDVDGDGLGDVCDNVLNWQMTYSLNPDKVAFSVRQSKDASYILCGYM